MQCREGILNVSPNKKKIVLKTVSKSYGVSGISIHYGSICKVVHCTTKELLHSLNIIWWVAGTCCHPQRRAEKSGGTFPSLCVHGLAQKCELWHSYTFIQTSSGLQRERSSPLCRQGCKYCANILCTRLCLESCCKVACTSWATCSVKRHQCWADCICWGAWSCTGTQLRSLSCNSPVALLKYFY